MKVLMEKITNESKDEMERSLNDRIGTQIGLIAFF